jgi:esterase/lipase superfamily enzyme
MKIKLLSLILHEFAQDPTKHFVIRTVRTLEVSEWCRQISQFPVDHALVFVHGFNTSFEEALYRTAQIVWDLKYQGVPVLFTWPSRGQVADYLYDRDSALGARDAFVAVLKRLKDQGKRINILAHSMGNFLVLDALATHQHEARELGLAELMMAAPDVDRDHFKGIAPAVRAVTSGMTLYASSADRALWLSKKAAGHIPRAGDVPAGGPIIVPQVDSIDVTSVGAEILGFNHAVVAQQPSILNDVRILIESGRRPPDARLIEIKAVPEGGGPAEYWRFTV